MKLCERIVLKLMLPSRAPGTRATPPLGLPVNPRPAPATAAAKPASGAPVRTASDVARVLAPLKQWRCGLIEGPKGRIVSTCYSDRKASPDLLIQVMAFTPKSPAA